MIHPHTHTSAENGSGSGTDTDNAESAKPAGRRGGLGRGLAALIPRATPLPQAAPVSAPAAPAVTDVVEPPAELAAPQKARSEAAATRTGEHLRKIPLRSITLSPNQPRKEFRREELDDLTASIKEHGIIQPIAVRLKRQGEDGAPSSYELIAGERRFRAASAAGLTEVPALVKEDISDRESLALAIIENVQREDLNVIETAQGYDELLHAYNMTQTELAQSIGKSQPQIANTLRMLNLPAPIQDSLRSWTISEGHAKVILSVKNEAEQTTLWNEIVQQNLTVRQAEKRAATLRAAAPASAKPTTPRAPAPSSGSRHLEEISRKISLSLGTKVRFFPGKGHTGIIEISYFDQDQLEDLIEKLQAGG